MTARRGRRGSRPQRRARDARGVERPAAQRCEAREVVARADGVISTYRSPHDLVGVAWSIPSGSGHEGRAR
jgi:hypothetical protein